MSLHDRIKEARKNKGLTQEQLGELIGVAKTTITGYEKNREPTAAKVGEIADVLGVDVNFLFQDEVKELHESHATPEEFENIIKKYRSLDPCGQEHVNTILDWEAARTATIQEQAEQINNLKSQVSELSSADYLQPQAAHDDYLAEEGEQEKVARDLQKLVRPK